MINRDTLMAALPVPTGTSTIRHNVNTSNNIIDIVETGYYKSLPIAANIAYLFKGTDNFNTICRVWNFVRNNIKYVKDQYPYQDIRLMHRFVSDGIGDCKSYSVFAASILANLGFNVSFKYTGYRGNKYPTHVYVLAEKNGITYIVDGVYNYCNAEKLPISYYKIHTMPVRELSGLEEAAPHYYQYIMNLPQYQNGSSAQKLAIMAQAKKRLQDNLIAEDIGRLSKTERKARRKKIGKKLSAGLKKVFLGAGRGAYLAMLRLNFRKLAWNADLALKRNPEGLRKMWEGLGGNFDRLVKSIKAGAKKKNLQLFGKDKQKRVSGIYGYEGTSIGFSGPEIAAMVAAAAPVLAIVVPAILKLNGGKHATEQTADGAYSTENVPEGAVPTAPDEPEYNTDEDGNDTSDGEALEGIGKFNTDMFNDILNIVQDSAQTAVKVGYYAKAAKAAKKKGNKRESYKSNDQLDADFEKHHVKKHGTEKDKAELEASGGMSNKTMLILGGAAVVGLLFFNKRK